MIGRTIGNYVVRQKIGEGGMGAVYLAEHPRIHRQVAIKVLLPAYSKNPTVVARFFNEARSANEIRNEHIIDILDFGELAEDGSSYIIMEWLDGRSLTSELERVGRFPVPRAIHIARGIGRALAAAHAHGIVHRDLKPDNIFLLKRQDDPDFVKVLDFGIAKLTQKSDASEHVKTQTGAIIGTPAYMSPEQCRGMTIDQRTDIYALGCILYHMLAGQLPFDAPALGELLLKHMTEVPRSPRTFDPTIPPHVDAAVMRALEKDPERRFARTEELLAALAAVETGSFAALAGPPAVTPPTMMAPAPAPAPRQDTLSSAAGQAMRSTTGERQAPPPGKSKTAPLVIGGVLTVAVGFGAVALVMTHGRGDGGAAKPPAATTRAAASPPATAPAPVVQPSAPVAPPSAPAAASAPATVHVSIRTLPADAAVLLDDKPVANPYDADLPRGATRHQVTVRLAGFKTDSQSITCEQDRRLEVVLEREAAPAVAAAPPAAPSHHESHAKKPAPLPLPRPPTPSPSTKPQVVATEPKPEPKPAAPTPPSKQDKAQDKAIYKGTKGKLITDFPSE